MLTGCRHTTLGSSKALTVVVRMTPQPRNHASHAVRVNAQPTRMSTWSQMFPTNGFVFLIFALILCVMSMRPGKPRKLLAKLLLGMAPPLAAAAGGGGLPYSTVVVVVVVVWTSTRFDVSSTVRVVSVTVVVVVTVGGGGGGASARTSRLGRGGGGGGGGGAGLKLAASVRMMRDRIANALTPRNMLSDDDTPRMLSAPVVTDDLNDWWLAASNARWTAAGSPGYSGEWSDPLYCSCPWSCCCTAGAP
mmetsp:Transcript_11403/g.33848  ORF Transcript_11403/g.33848 Transcript_11403/m.33848 type:complete len:248 (+) Transcript_11403:1119-1862(+)